MAEFTHLHLHTDYSLLDGACKIKELAKMCTQFGMKAMAITDHGSMAGAIEFYNAMTDHGIKPIIGCECYMAPGPRTEKNPNHPHARGYHQLLLAKDFEGYQNLCRLNATSYLDGFYHKPRIDREVLSQYSKGLIGTTSCLGGEIPQAILEDNIDKARRILGEYVDIFGKENYYLELQDHNMGEQAQCNKALVKFAKEFDVPLLATNDAHYLTQDHALPHEVLLCIGTQKSMKEDHMRFPSDQFYVKTAEEMCALFEELPESLSNTMEVAERCNIKFDFKTNHYPVYETPGGCDRRQYMEGLCKRGLIERYGFDLDAIGYPNLAAEHKVAVDRMTYEIDVIERMGFISYFLVVWDFLDFARKEGIPVGPGRGSGAGSIVAFLLFITDIEPLRFNLLFERFLNPDRVSPPDFDIDLCERRRVEVIEYVRNKYGAENVAQIGTFGTLKAKAVLKDVARAIGRDFNDGNRLTKAVPTDPKMTLARAMEESQDLRIMREAESWVDEVFRYSEPLEGLVRHMSIHAAGVIIGDQPLTNLVPLAKGANNEAITQFSAVPCEDLGLLKMDFLGLRTLTIIQDCCDILEKIHGRVFDPSAFPLDDPGAYALLNKGRTVAVFQLESGGMQDLCRKFGVDRIEDIIALIALYRPGPMQFIDDFISRKMGHTIVEYDHPAMKETLEETWGIMLYQEQVMQAVQKVAGFTLAEADLLRRAMGKKKVEVMEAQREKFIEGAAKKGISESVAQAIFEKIEMFAGYGFNKSHSAAYAFIAFRTAYLKANYPIAFMAANLTAAMTSADAVTGLIHECSEMNIPVLPPDVNSSELRFTVDAESIRFGLAAIKGVGQSASEAVIQARSDGPFETMLHFCEKVGSTVNRRTMENLVCCGAFDSFGMKRSQMLLMVEDVISRAQTSIRDRDLGQENFFDMLGGDDGGTADDLVVPDVPEWDQRDILKQEKELLGFYVTGHPLGEFSRPIRAFSLATVQRIITEMEDGTGVRIGGLIAGLEVKYSKKDGSPWAVIYLECLDGMLECLCFSRTYAEFASAVDEEAIVVVEGFVANREGEERSKMILSKVMSIDDAIAEYTEELHIRFHQSEVDTDTMNSLQQLLVAHPGTQSVILSVTCDGGEIAFVELEEAHRVRLSLELEQGIERLLGEKSIHIKANRVAPERRQRFQRPAQGQPAMAS
ncbi:MAG: DNA polymerase-3 subunit alpha [Rhodothermales bacterium]|jgi:DNA polymerase-3 subunit alpha